MLCWELFNEPDNANVGAFGGASPTPDLPPRVKFDRARELLKQTFAWARAVNPSQRLTAGVWGAPGWLEAPDPIERLSLENSDVITFHSYHGPERTLAIIEGLQRYGRPILCTEYVARSRNSTFQGILPIFAEHGVGAYSWGLVQGKSQTLYPWDSWTKTYAAEPDPWFHDFFRRDGTPYSREEARLIRDLTSRRDGGR